MKKYITALAFILITASAVAQDLYGEATYFSKTAVDKSWMEGNRDITPERRKRIEENLKKMNEKSYTLAFNRSEALWKENKELAAPGQSRGWGSFMGTSMGGEKYKDMTANTFIEQRDMMGKTFLIVDDLPQLEWNITGEMKQIGNYTAIKATAVKKNDELDMSAWRRRGRDDKKKKEEEEKKEDAATDEPTKLTDMFEKVDETVVTAWFTPEIPVQHGPADYGGLPGLILEVSANKTTLLCTKITMNPDERMDIEPATKGDETTLEVYNETFQKKMEEMSQRFRGGRGGRGGRRQ
ncbi:GLPGLI family protein [Nonlabens ponticola]|uniref:GLPGLI family protein n=1 Tax=Nonlabens ponticola TaxID=2496866 RepID=A0A3S9MWE4_9FLAO|nr:GLPGLI family protein [Nonlabens ponticola]AZQ43462.1 GLPGLI family protein [Nonlabens ponticola]